MIVEKLHEAGLRGEHAHGAAPTSTVTSLLSRDTPLKPEKSAEVDRAGRWGSFVGARAPAFFGPRPVLGQYEKDGGPPHRG
ncbi:hypothetical protein ACIQU1_22785 [Streptomyces angustmyceticus]|uniref:hypothetical protein n=1 Tax=Streptomyces angustmyceticus TaxID=285578 RepID=UPI0038229EB9